MDEPTEPPNAESFHKLMKVAETKISISLAVSLYFKPPPESYKDGLLQCYEEFLKLSEPRLRWFADETGKKYREARADVLRIPFDRAPAAIANGRPYSWGAFAGEHHRDAASSQFHGKVPRVDGYRMLGHLRAAFPVETFIHDLRLFVGMVKDFGARAPVLHGTAGYFFSEAMVIGQMQTNEALLVPSAMRFAGIEVDGHGGSADCCQEAIKGVNWLTLISSIFVDRLGGMRELRKQLSDDILLHPMPWGLLIQAGPAPNVGDVNEGERLALYREVNKALRPVRVRRHSDLGVLFEETRTKRWIERFDD